MRRPPTQLALAVLAIAALFPGALLAAPPVAGPTPAPAGPSPGVPGAASAAPYTPPPYAPASARPTVLPTAAGVATATPSGALVKYSGQLLDVRGGFVFFTSGDGFRLAPNVATVDYKTGKPTSRAASTGLYAVATFASSGQVVQLAISPAPVLAEASYEAVRPFVVLGTKTVTNPELAPGKEGLSGRPVPVTFTVLVPPTTQLGQPVFIETDKSNWDPQEHKLDRIDALHYRVTLRLDSGTHFLYRYTRGSATTVERSRSDMEVPPRNLFVREIDVYNQDDTVFHWADDAVNGGGSTLPGPDNVPTPFSANPFPYPTPPIPPGKGGLPSPPPIGPPPPLPTPH